MTHTLPHLTHAQVGPSRQPGAAAEQPLPAPPVQQPHSREGTIRPRARDIFAIPSHARTAAPHHELEDPDEAMDTPRQGRPAPTVFRSAPDTQPRQPRMAGQPDPNSIPRIILPDAGPSSLPYHAAQNGAAPAQDGYFPGPAYQPLPPPHPSLPPQLLHSALTTPRGAGLSSAPTLSNPPPYSPPPPVNANQRRGARGRNGPEAPPNTAPQAGGRFPRWRGWLEKRALERHFDRLGVGTPEDEGMRRKKSWGTGVNDPDAVSDEEPDLQEEIPQRILPPLHVHQMGRYVHAWQFRRRLTPTLTTLVPMPSPIPQPLPPTSTFTASLLDIHFRTLPCYLRASSPTSWETQATESLCAADRHARWSVRS